jgi:hypothetical protein
VASAAHLRQKKPGKHRASDTISTRSKASLVRPKREDILRQAKQSKLYGELHLKTVVLLGLKTCSRWEVVFLNLIRVLTSFKAATDPLTKADVAAYLGCSVRTADTVVSRLLRDKLIARKKQVGQHGWCYSTSHAMIQNGPDQAEEQPGEITAKQNPEIEDEPEAQVSVVEEVTETAEQCSEMEQVRKPLRMFSTPRLLLPGKDSGPVPVPEGVQIRSVRVAETPDSDNSIAWSDAVIDEDGGITVWIHSCRKKPAVVETQATPHQHRGAGEAELRRVLESQFGEDFATLEFPSMLPMFRAALGQAPLGDFAKWLADDKLPEKRKYPVNPGLFKSFAEEFRQKWPAWRSASEASERARLESETREAQMNRQLAMDAEYSVFQERWALDTLKTLSRDELDQLRREQIAWLKTQPWFGKIDPKQREAEVENRVLIALAKRAPSMDEWLKTREVAV